MSAAEYAVPPGTRSCTDWVRRVFAVYGAAFIIAMFNAWWFAKAFLQEVVLKFGAVADQAVKARAAWFDSLELSLLVDNRFWHAAQLKLIMPNPAYFEFMRLVFAPFIEEMLRLAVFVMMLNFANRWKKGELSLVVIALSGVGFGLLHRGPMSVFVQGCVGALIGFMFVSKYVKRGYGLVSTYFACVSVHFLYNLSITLVR